MVRGRALRPRKKADRPEAVRGCWRERCSRRSTGCQAPRATVSSSEDPTNVDGHRHPGLGQLIGVEKQRDIERRVAEATEQELLEEWWLKLIGRRPETGPSRREELGRCDPHPNTSWTKVSPSGVSAGCPPSAA